MGATSASLYTDSSLQLCTREPDDGGPVAGARSRGPSSSQWDVGRCARGGRVAKLGGLHPGGLLYGRRGACALAGGPIGFRSGRVASPGGRGAHRSRPARGRCAVRLGGATRPALGPLLRRTRALRGAALRGWGSRPLCRRSGAHRRAGRTVAAGTAGSRAPADPWRVDGRPWRVLRGARGSLPRYGGLRRAEPRALGALGRWVARAARLGSEWSAVLDRRGAEPAVGVGPAAASRSRWEELPARGAGRSLRERGARGGLAAPEPQADRRSAPGSVVDERSAHRSARASSCAGAGVPLRDAAQGLHRTARPLAGTHHVGTGVPRGRGVTTRCESPQGASGGSPGARSIACVVVAVRRPPRRAGRGGEVDWPNRCEAAALPGSTPRRVAPDGGRRGGRCARPPRGPPGAGSSPEAASRGDVARTALPDGRGLGVPEGPRGHSVSGRSGS